SGERGLAGRPGDAGRRGGRPGYRFDAGLWRSCRRGRRARADLEERRTDDDQVARLQAGWLHDLPSVDDRAVAATEIFEDVAITAATVLIRSPQAGQNRLSASTGWPHRAHAAVVGASAAEASVSVSCSPGGLTGGPPAIAPSLPGDRAAGPIPVPRSSAGSAGPRFWLIGTS